MSIANYCDENSQHISLKNSIKSVCIKNATANLAAVLSTVRLRKHDIKLNQKFSTHSQKLSMNVSAAKATSPDDQTGFL